MLTAKDLICILSLTITLSPHTLLLAEENQGLIEQVKEIRKLQKIEQKKVKELEEKLSKLQSKMIAGPYFESYHAKSNNNNRSWKFIPNRSGPLFIHASLDARSDDIHATLTVDFFLEEITATGSKKIFQFKTHGNMNNNHHTTFVSRTLSPAAKVEKGKTYRFRWEPGSKTKLRQENLVSISVFIY